MAIYHLSVKAIQRSKGQSAVAAASYRSAEKITDLRTGEIHDYTKKNGVIFSQIITPDNENISRADLWNNAEQREKRKDSTIAKEHVLALPCELSSEERKELTLAYANYLVQSYGCAVDIAIHEPNKAGDERNFHAHLLVTTRVFKNGELTNKTDIELCDTDRKKKGLEGRKEELEKARKTWENLVNKSLEKANLKEKVSSKSLINQGIFDREPQQHQGKSAIAIQRKGQIPRRKRFQEKIVNIVNIANQVIDNLKLMINHLNCTIKKVDEEISEEVKNSRIKKIEVSHHISDEKDRQIKTTKNQDFFELDKLARAECIKESKDELTEYGQKMKDEKDKKRLDEWKKPYLVRAELGKDFLELAKYDSSEEGKAELKEYQKVLMQELKPTGWSITKKEEYIKPFIQKLKIEDIANRKNKILYVANDIKFSLVRGLNR